MEILIARHGETEWNVARRIQGHLDSPLTERGRRQAADLAELVEREGVDAIFASDLGRAVETARPSAEIRSLETIRDDRLRERSYGVLEGLTRDEARERWPEADACRRPGSTLAPEGGESWHDLFERTCDVVSEIARSAVGERVLVVCHGGNLDVIFRLVVGLRVDADRRFALANGALARVSFDAGGWKLLQWGARPIAAAGTGTTATPRR